MATELRGSISEAIAANREELKRLNGRFDERASRQRGRCSKNLLALSKRLLEVNAQAGQAQPLEDRSPPLWLVAESDEHHAPDSAPCRAACGDAPRDRSGTPSCPVETSADSGDPEVVPSADHAGAGEP